MSVLNIWLGMGDNNSNLRDMAAALDQLNAIQIGGQSHIPPVTGVGDSITVVATGAQVPNRTLMAETRYPSAVRLPTQSCQSSAAVFIMRTSASLEQVKRCAIAVEELMVGRAGMEENFSSFQQQVNEESREFCSCMENRFDHFAALILNHESEGKSTV